MVLSLVDLALISITDGMKNGSIRNPHMLPPRLRQLVMDKVLKSVLGNDPKCLAILLSSEFLNGMTSISIRNVMYFSNHFYRRLRQAMTATLPNGEKVEAAVTKLAFSSGECDAMERDDDCKRMLENVTELSIRKSAGILRSRCHPIINFKQLTIFKSDDCFVDINLWPEFLRNIPTLEYLQITDVQVKGDVRPEVLDKLLPIFMPHLKSLEFTGHNRWGQRQQLFNCNEAFVDNLLGCPELRRVHLMLDESSTDEESLIRLASMVADRNIEMKITVRFVVSYHDNADSAAFDSPSKFNVVRILHERIDKIDLRLSGDWKPHFSAALDNMVTTCLNLTTFHFDIHVISESSEGMKRINAALVRFFGNSERALQLKDLYLSGNFDETVVSAVFENCLNVVKLEILYCPALRDQHLIDWVDRDGGKLSEFKLFECISITNEGVIPILIRSAEGLLRCFLFMAEPRGGRSWKQRKDVLENRCPNIQYN